MSTKHTPGPWVARGAFIEQPSGTPTPIAVVDMHGMPWQANAHLIASPKQKGRQP